MSNFEEWRKNIKTLINSKYRFADIPQLQEAIAIIQINITRLYEAGFDARNRFKKIQAVSKDLNKLRHIVNNLIDLQRLYNDPNADIRQLNLRLELSTLEPPKSFYNYAVEAMVNIYYVSSSVDMENFDYDQWKEEQNAGDAKFSVRTIGLTFDSPNPNFKTPTRRSDPEAIYIIDLIKGNSAELALINEESASRIVYIELALNRDTGRFQFLQVHRAEDINVPNYYRQVRLHGQYITLDGIEEKVTYGECGKLLLEYSGFPTRDIDFSDGISLEELEQFIHYTNTSAVIVNLFDEPIIKYTKKSKSEYNANGDYSKISKLFKGKCNYPRKSGSMIVAKVANGHLYNITNESQRNRYIHPNYKTDKKPDTRPIVQLECYGNGIDCECSASYKLEDMKGLYSTTCDLCPLYQRCLNCNYIPRVFENKNKIKTITIGAITIYHDNKRNESKSLLDLYNSIYDTQHIYINQSFQSILKMFLPTFKSVMNEQTSRIFDNNISSGGYFEQEEHNQLKGLDMNAAYPTIMKNNLMPVFDGSELIQSFSGTIQERSLYYINPKSNNLMCQAGYFYGCVVQEFLNAGFIVTTDILDEINPKSSTSDIQKLMNIFEEKINNKYLLKEIRCNISGLLGQLDTTTKVARTTSLQDMYACGPGVSYKVDASINLNIILTSPEGIKTTLVTYQTPIYKVIREEKEQKLESSRPAYVYIIHKNYANLLKLRKWILSIPGSHITGYKTDAIYFTSEQIETEIGMMDLYQPSKDPVEWDTMKILREDQFKYIGTPKGTKWINGTTAIKNTNVHHYQKYTRIMPTRAVTLIIDNSKPINLSEYKEGFHIDSMPGTGKTAILKQLAQIYPQAKIITFTNAVAHNIGGQTLHNFFNQKITEIDYNKPFKVPKILLVDECYNIPAEFYPLIARCKAKGSIIYSFGDSEQLESIDKRRMTQDEKKLFWSRMSNINIVLSHNWRSNNEYVELCKTDYTPPKYDKTIYGLINICKYNSSREQINQALFNLYGYKRFVVTKNFKKENLFKGQIYELENDMITLLYRGPTEKRPFKQSYLKYIEPGYATTNHIAQGSSINEPYTIVDFDKMNQRARFVALTRTTDPSLITTAAALPRDKRQPKKTWKDNKYI